MIRMSFVDELIRKSIIISVFCVSFFLLASAANAFTSLGGSTDEQPEYLPNQIVVVYKNNSEIMQQSAHEYTALANSFDLETTLKTIVRQEMRATLGDEDIEVEAELLFQTTSGDITPLSEEDTSLALITIKSTRFSTSELLQKLENNPDIDSISPNYLFYPLEENGADLWNIFNNSKDAGTNANKAWEKGITGKNVTVAVIDTGVQLNHPDLINNIWKNTGESNCTNGIDDDSNGYVDDCNGWDFVNNSNDPNPRSNTGSQFHGTHVAGTIAAVRNGTGVVGVAPDAKIMPIRIIGTKGGASLTTLLKAAEYALDNGAHVINMSLGVNISCSPSIPLFDFHKRLEPKNIVLVAASGNAGPNVPSTPANCPGVIGVGATDNSKKLASFSSYSKNTVDVVAPGVSILSTVINGYKQFSGTSMAAPHVAGAVALLKSSNPELKNDQVLSLLCDNAEDLGDKGRDEKFGCGFIDIEKIFNAIKPDAPVGGDNAACELIKSGSTVPAGFAAPFNLFSTAHELLLKVVCSDGAEMTVGNGDPMQYIFGRGYVLRNNQWSAVTFSGNSPTNPDWILGEAKAKIMGLDLAQNNYVLAHICQYVDNTWKCGCQNSACLTPSWNVQYFRKQ